MEESKETMPTLRIFKSCEDARIDPPAKAGDVGYDLYASEDCEYGCECEGDKSHRVVQVISTGIHVAIPPGYYGRVAPRSGLAMKHHVNVLGGVVDQGYRGEIKVLLETWNDFGVAKGDKIAQLILEKCDVLKMEEVSNEKELGCTERGITGFGSTG